MKKTAKKNFDNKPKAHQLVSFSYMSFCNDECMSTLTPAEIKQLFKMKHLISSHVWLDVIQNNSVQPKAISTSIYPRKIPDEWSNQSKIIELRINQKSRIWGVFNENIFYVVSLDKNHSIFS